MSITLTEYFISLRASCRSSRRLLGRGRGGSRACATCRLAPWVLRLVPSLRGPAPCWSSGACGASLRSRGPARATAAPSQQTFRGRACRSSGRRCRTFARAHHPCPWAAPEACARLGLQPPVCACLYTSPALPSGESTAWGGQASSSERAFFLDTNLVLFEVKVENRTTKPSGATSSPVFFGYKYMFFTCLYTHPDLKKRVLMGLDDRTSTEVVPWENSP
ncbi:hypothetical protein [Yellowstone lake phycodnavirus 2]|uniref:hypothetical protein n=1 Tax=Yellowstone lake phycodnavirus 2 TaxID=1586714 RepID=UPI0006EB90D2|nr:hypothetical protein AR678_gp152 [Yellowstone lake phycodnavirus 2]BAT22426.1 hypothetical protein [Yellowstone lake phycodnavirus 2]